MTDQYIITKELRDLVAYRLRNEGYRDLVWRLEKETTDNPYNPQAERDIEQLKKAIIEVLDTGFESSEGDMMLVIDRIEAWEKGELQQEGKDGERE